MAKLPENAKRVFKGILYDVYHFEQEMFDGTTRTFEMLHRKPSVQVIPIKDGKVLLAHEEQPGSEEFTTFFGGCSDEDEDQLNAAKRELKEETGLVSDDWEELFVLEIPGRINWDIHFFVARDCKQVDQPKLDGGEKIKPVELSFEEFIEFTKRDDFRNKVFKGHMANYEYKKENVEFLRKKLGF